MVPTDSKSYQLRVRVTAEERDHLEKLRQKRGRGETISDLVREAISLLVEPIAGPDGLSPGTRRQVERLAVLLKREPGQVEAACVEGILDLIELKCEVPLIVMETRLHLQYRNRNEPQEFPWKAEPAPSTQVSSAPEAPISATETPAT